MNKITTRIADLTIFGFRQILLILFALALSKMALAQTTRDVVWLKNGSIIKGIIIEQTPPVQLKIQTADGSVYVIKFDEIDKITKEEVKSEVKEEKPAIKKEPPKMEEYGRTVGLGIAIGGGGLIGAPVRLNFTRSIAMELGLHLRPTYYSSNVSYIESKFLLPIMLTGGFDFFLNEKFYEYKNVIIKDGVMIRAGTDISISVSESIISLGWARERFRVGKKNSSYLFELGAGAYFFDPVYSTFSELGFDSNVIPMLYWKFHWNWYLNGSSKN
ncbi:MAG TPA: hypothetical protein VE978_12825 [Chitinophagales bacterium]|nr:hypothetical protein [Chitinophagales bacterium]